MINLLSLEEKRKIRSDYYRRVISVCLPLSATILVIAISSLLPSYFFAINSYNKIVKESQSAEVVSKKTQEDEMRGMIIETNKKISILKVPEKNNGAWDFFDAILKTRTPNVRITSYSYEKKAPAANAKQTVSGTNIVLQGTSKNRESIQSFSTALKQNPSFTTVDLPLSSLVNESDFPYSINIIVKE